MAGNPKDMLDALSAPMGELIAAVGRSVAEAQQALDAQTVANFKTLYGGPGGDEQLALLRELGYQPTWYHIPEVTAELNIALSITGTAESGAGAAPRISKARLYAAPVDAGYVNRYGYNLNAASVVKFRIVPVPPSTTAQSMRVVPNLLGKAWGEARALLDEQGLSYQLGEISPANDAAKVKAQSPAAGELLTGARSVQISF